MLVGLKGTRFGAGEEISAASGVCSIWRPSARPVYRDGWLVLHEAVVVPEWIDYNGHMTEFRYLQVLADATDAVLRHIGIDADYIAAAGLVLHGRDPYPPPRRGSRGRRRCTSPRSSLRHDPKRLHLFHEARRSADGTVVATGEHMLLHVDPSTHRVAPAPDDVLRALDAIAERQRALPRPDSAGRRIS